MLKICLKFRSNSWDKHKIITATKDKLNSKDMLFRHIANRKKNIAYLKA